MPFRWAAAKMTQLTVSVPESTRSVLRVSNATSQENGYAEVGFATVVNFESSEAILLTGFDMPSEQKYNSSVVTLSNFIVSIIRAKSSGCSSSILKIDAFMVDLGTQACELSRGIQYHRTLPRGGVLPEVFGQHRLQHLEPHGC
jgi:hypothetical protein